MGENVGELKKMLYDMAKQIRRRVAIIHIVKAVGEPDAGNSQVRFDEGVLGNSRTLLYPRGKILPIGDSDQGRIKVEWAQAHN